MITSSCSIPQTLWLDQAESDVSAIIDAINRGDCDQDDSILENYIWDHQEASLDHLSAVAQAIALPYQLARVAGVFTNILPQLRDQISSTPKLMTRFVFFPDAAHGLKSEQFNLILSTFPHIQEIIWHALPTEEISPSQTLTSLTSVSIKCYTPTPKWLKDWAPCPIQSRFQ